MLNCAVDARIYVKVEYNNKIQLQEQYVHTYKQCNTQKRVY